MFPVAPEGKLKFGEPLKWKSLPPLAERVHEGEPFQGKLMDVPKFEQPEDTIQPVGATEGETAAYRSESPQRRERWLRGSHGKIPQ